MNLRRRDYKSLRQTHSHVKGLHVNECNSISTTTGIRNEVAYNQALGLSLLRQTDEAAGTARQFVSQN